jgi:hypothetical protein
MQLLKQSLDQGDITGEGSVDPFQALKHGEAVAEAIAIKLAPKRVPKAGELCGSFCFAGHRLLLRELNWLREARVFVESALCGSVGAAHIALSNGRYWCLSYHGGSSGAAFLAPLTSPPTSP